MPARESSAGGSPAFRAPEADNPREAAGAVEVVQTPFVHLIVVQTPLRQLYEEEVRAVAASGVVEVVQAPFVHVVVVQTPLRQLYEEEVREAGGRVNEVTAGGRVKEVKAGGRVNVDRGSGVVEVVHAPVSGSQRVVVQKPFEQLNEELRKVGAVVTATDGSGADAVVHTPAASQVTVVHTPSMQSVLEL